MRNTWIGVCLLLVAGSLDVDGSGNVTAYVLDHPEKLPAGVTQLLAQTLPAFRFEPVRRDGVPRPVHATMNLVVAANRVDPQHFSIRVRSARFTDADVPASERVTINVGKVPRYPEEAVWANVGGAVYVAMRIDRSGNVLDAQVQQVNLFAVDTEPQMRHWRSVLGKATLKTVRRYTFKVPTTGAHAADATFTGVLPVVYRVGAGGPVYGQWDTYVPGPREDIAWLTSDDVLMVAGETIPDGVFAQTGTTLKLLTPISGG